MTALMEIMRAFWTYLDESSDFSLDGEFMYDTLVYRPSHDVLISRVYIVLTYYWLYPDMSA